MEDKTKICRRTTCPYFHITALDVEFPADMTWFKANVNGTGFYRVNYPRENWVALTETLKKDHTTFSALDRAQLINDAFALTRYLHIGVNYIIHHIYYI